MNEMLNNAKPKERFADGDAFDVSRILSLHQGALRKLICETYIDSQQIAKKCRSVQPKIQKWIEDSAENDPGAMGESFFISSMTAILRMMYE